VAIRLIGKQSSGNKLEYQGFSTDVKPMDLKENNNGSSFVCLDTGDLYYWHIDNWVQFGTGGSSLSGKLFVMTGGVTLQNSAVETSMLDGGVGDKVIPANSLKAGDILEFYWFSRLTCGNSQQTYVRFKLGGILLKEHLATLPNNLTANMFEGSIKLVILSDGVGGTCRISGSSEVMQKN
jgi:hypothetical protein